MISIIKNKTFDEERALYNLTDATVECCDFRGPADGESALKESRNILVKDCSFSLRYPLWHTDTFTLENSTMDSFTRAPIWYAENGVIDGCKIDGIKCLRECKNIKIKNCDIHSPEFGWRCANVSISDTEIESEYFLFECENVDIHNLTMKGKYSFQYIKNMSIKDSSLDTKDAFWHTKNVTVKNSTVKGEYLGWYSENLTFIDCKIVGTQPLCYCKNLKLVNCEMVDTDLAFEYSEVEADIIGDILSVKNPKSGFITADSIGRIITEDSVVKTNCKINIRQVTK